MLQYRRVTKKPNRISFLTTNFSTTRQKWYWEVKKDNNEKNKSLLPFVSRYIHDSFPVLVPYTEIILIARPTEGYEFLNHPFDHDSVRMFIIPVKEGLDPEYCTFEISLESISAKKEVCVHGNDFLDAYYEGAHIASFTCHTHPTWFRNWRFASSDRSRVTTRTTTNSPGGCDRSSFCSRSNLDRYIKRLGIMDALGSAEQVACLDQDEKVTFGRFILQLMDQGGRFYEESGSSQTGVVSYTRVPSGIKVATSVKCSLSAISSHLFLPCTSLHKHYFEYTAHINFQSFEVPYTYLVSAAKHEVWEELIDRYATSGGYLQPPSDVVSEAPCSISQGDGSGEDIIIRRHTRLLFSDNFPANHIPGLKKIVK
jgi:hypothetical protein